MRWRIDTGLKSYAESKVEVTANEVRYLGKVTLALGSIAEQVSVVNPGGGRKCQMP